jgi:hypothetical protein
MEVSSCIQQWPKGLLRRPRSGLEIKPDHASLSIAVAPASQPPALAKSRSAAALAFDHLVALLQQPFAFAILALLLLLDVGAFFIGHDSLQTSVPESADLIDVLASTGGKIRAATPVADNPLAIMLESSRKD